MLAIERCHLRVEAMVATPYAAGLSTLVDDEAELGAALIDFGGGSTTVGVFAGGRLVHVDAVAVGGNHVTMDIARGLNGRLADAERLKTLYGACIASPSDDRETIAVHRLGDDMDHPSPSAEVASWCASSARASRRFSNSCATGCGAPATPRHAAAGW